MDIVVDQQGKLLLLFKKKKNAFSFTLELYEKKLHKDNRLNTKTTIIFYSFMFCLVKEKLYAVGLDSLYNIEKSINQIN